MISKMLCVTALILFSTSACAVSGGHVVGNSMIPAGAAKKMAEDTPCDCASKKGAKAAKDCDCKKQNKDEKATCSAGDDSCKK